MQNYKTENHVKIAYCLQALHRTGGIERVVTTKANWLVANGYEVAIITTDQRDNQPAFWLDGRVQHIDLGLNYELDNELGRWGRLRALRAKRKIHKQRLEEALSQFNPDITVSTFFQDASILPTLKDGSKKILELHSSKYTKILMYPSERWVMRLYGKFQILKQESIARTYDKFVILTEEERSLFSHFSNVEVVPNALPFTPDKTADYEAKKIIAIGRFEYQKNFFELIDIWAKVHKEYPDWQLELVGHGPYWDAIQQKVKALGLEQSVILFGISANVVERLSQASVYVLTSHFEGFGMVLIEAQSVGLPVVSYACPSGPRDIVTDGKDGYLVPLYDKETFAQKLMTLMESENLRRQMGSVAKQASQRFEVDTVMQKWVKLFEKLK